VDGADVDGADVDGAAVEGPAVEGPAVKGAAVTGPAVAGPDVAGPVGEGRAVAGPVVPAADPLVAGPPVAIELALDGAAVTGGASVLGVPPAAPRCWRLNASMREARSSTRVERSVSEVVRPSSRRLSASTWRLPSVVCERRRASTARLAAASASVRARCAACCAATTSLRSWITSSCDAVPVTSCTPAQPLSRVTSAGSNHGEEARPPRRRVGRRQRGLTRKCARRFFAQHSSVFSVQTGRSSP
jgi:hypothetical protein